MKLTVYLIAIIFIVTFFSSCTSDDSVEEGLLSESQSFIEHGEDELPIDNEKIR